MHTYEQARYLRMHMTHVRMNTCTSTYMNIRNRTCYDSHVNDNTAFQKHAPIMLSPCGELVVEKL